MVQRSGLKRKRTIASGRQTRQRTMAEYASSGTPYGPENHPGFTTSSTNTGPDSHFAIRRVVNPSEMRKRVRSWDNSSRYPRFSGRGDYRSTWANVKKGIKLAGQALVPVGTFGKLGTALGSGVGMGVGTAYGPAGSMIGGVGGGALGNAAGNKFAEFVGFGDYQIKQNSLMDLPMGQPVASFGNMSNATIVSHREFVTNIRAPAANPATFTNTELNMNPGLRSSFPWLSSIANNYQEYQFIGAVFEYRSLSSDSASALPLGNVIIASNYDTADPKYTDNRHMQNSQFCVSGKPSSNLIHPIECDPKISFSPLKYTRSAGLPDNTDSRLYDHVKVQIATEGLPAGSEGATLGELWVTYEVALYKPQLGVTAALRDHYVNPTAIVGVINSAFPFGTTANVRLPQGGFSNGLGITLAGTLLTFPIGTAPGQYEVQMVWSGAANFQGVLPNLAVSPASALMSISNYYGGPPATSAIQNTTNGTGGQTTVFIIAHVTIVDNLVVPTSIQLSAQTYNTAPTLVEVQIAALPDGQT